VCSDIDVERVTTVRQKRMFCDDEHVSSQS